MNTRHGTLAATLLLACLIARSQDSLPEVKGRVVTADDTPIAGARLTLHLTRGDTFTLRRHWPDRQLAETTSDSEGRFAITLPERSVLIDEVFCLCVSHPNYAHEAVYRVTPWYLPSLERTITLERGAPFRGTVTAKQGESALGGESTTPVAGAEVEIYRNVFGQVPQNYLVASTRADEQGRYSFPHLAPKERLRMVARSNVNEVETHGLQADLQLGTKRREGGARIERFRGYGNPSSLNLTTGRVIDVASSRPVAMFAVGVTKDPKAAWPAPWERELFGNDAALEPRSFRWWIPYGRQTVGIFAQGYAMKLVTVEPTQTAALGDILLERGVSISGRIVDPRGEPVARARVHVRPATWDFDRLASNTISQERYWVPHAFTDENGQYRIDHVAAGSVNVMAASPGFAPVMIGPVVIGTTPLQGQDLALTPGGRIVGRVVNGDQLRIGSVSIPLVGNRFEIGGLPSGAYTLTLGKAAMCVVRGTTVNVVAGETVEVEIRR